MGIVRECGWCGHRCHMQDVHYVEIGPSHGWGQTQQVDKVFQCDGCGHLTLASGQVELVAGFGDTGTTRRFVADGQDAWLPRQVGKRVYADVPETIASMAAEAHQCLAIDANRAAVAMARAVVEATAKDQGIVTGTLERKIDKLFEKQLIREYVRDAAHEVRFGGNEVAHGDLVAEPIDNATAAEILGLMDEMLDEVYQSPARVRHRTARRLEREKRLREGVDATPALDTSEAQADGAVVVPYSDEPPF